ncbi:MGT family glycosyltransferase [Pararhizobium capsulatum DSM 1112]|uniref:MGT family glycosyltransferase n=1 Tax=Pararhizobium capsulatum DSM 1112 TaxID=1121113 RepID=A0ABU0BS95_9HYPH|nr:glycosyltransferase [Pararhizobium capsulatum]MDQ0321119.1 MGT family glycosyltransferase [Pararhizobium capsulatum DSM 1112]
MTPAKTIALFPEASYGAALNCVGIAQELRRLGATPVFICHPGFSGIFADYGFAEYQLGDDTSAPATDWTDFIERHQDAFRQCPFNQLQSYVGPTWDAIVDTAIRVEEPLRQVLARLQPDAIVLDNVVMFPAIANAGVPWIRVVSCAETEIPDPLVPPYLSGCSDTPGGEWDRFSERYQEVTSAAHKRFAAFLNQTGLNAPSAPNFLDPSPYLNLLLAPNIIRHERRNALDEDLFVFLDGCVRHEATYVPPRFASHNEEPLALVSFGSLGAMDVAMMKRMIAAFSTLPYRFLVNAGHWRDEYRDVPDNVFIDAWFPQPSVVEQANLFIHHGGNNSFCEALYFGVPSIVMPYCWDGHDNARRAEEAGVGRHLGRYDWSESELARAITDLMSDEAMRARLKGNAVRMQKAAGVKRAAEAILKVATAAPNTRLSG